MKRRRLLGTLGTIAVPLAGCSGRVPRQNGTSPTTTCEEPTPSEVRTVTETTATTTDEGDSWTPPYDLRVRYAGPAGSDTDSVITVTITELVEGDCDPVVFVRKYELEQGAEVAVDDPFAETDGGTYRIDAQLSNGNAATREVSVPADGVPDYAGYTVNVQSGGVEIFKVEV